MEEGELDHSDPETLRELYHSEGLSLEKIGELAGVSGEGVRYQMDKHGINRRAPSEHHGDTEDRFWRKVDGKGKSGCWEWTAACRDNGYGVFWDGESLIGAHRQSYKMEYGGVGDNQVNHHCDNPQCVNPDHLYAGSQSDNMADAVERSGVDNYVNENGEEHPQAKLEADDVREIRKLLADEKSHAEVADIYDVHKSTISSISCGLRWNHVE